jgi:ribosomal protein S18 acetylase RimI-like enzyme
VLNSQARRGPAVLFRSRKWNVCRSGSAARARWCTDTTLTLYAAPPSDYHRGVPAPLSIRPATLEDGLPIAQLHIEGWRSMYRGIVPEDVLSNLDLVTSVASWESRIERGNTPIIVAERNQRVLGFATIGPSRDDDSGVGSAELLALYVATDCQRAGVGRKLCEAAVAHIAEHGGEDCRVWIAQANTAGIAFYTRLGFQPDGSTKVDTSLIGSAIAELRLARPCR